MVSRQKLSIIVLILLFGTIVFRNLILPDIAGIALLITFFALFLVFVINKLTLAPKFYVMGVLFLVCFTLGGYFISPYEIERLILGLWYSLGVFVFFIVFYNLNLNGHNRKILINCVIIMLGLVAFWGFTQAILLPKPATDVSSSLAFIRGYSSTIGNSVLFYTSLVYLQIFVLAKQLEEKKLSYLLLAIFATVLVFGTFSRVLILCSVCAWLYFFYLKKSVQYKLYGTFFFLTLLIFSASYQDVIVSRFAALSVYFDSESVYEIARSAMAYNALQIAQDRFPFGAGVGMYGSVPAAFMYSPIYSEYGMDRIYGLTPGALNSGVNYLTDTFWPQIIGEFGFIGASLYITLLMYPVYMGYRRYKVIHRGDSLFQVTSLLSAWFSLVMLLFVSLLMSLSSPLPVSPLGLFLSSGISAIYLKIIYQWELAEYEGKI